MEEAKREEERVARIARLKRAHDDKKQSKRLVKEITKGKSEVAVDQDQLLDRLMTSLDPFKDTAIQGTGSNPCSSLCELQPESLRRANLSITR